MKKCALLIALFLVGFLTPEVTQAQIVAGRNAVGFIEIDLEPGQFAFLSMPFYKVAASGAEFTIDEFFKDQLSGDLSLKNSDKVLFWDENQQEYTLYWNCEFPGGIDRCVKKGEYEATTDTIGPGDTFWVMIHENSPGTTLVLRGEVPDRFTLPTYTTRIDAWTGKRILNGLAYPYPVEINFDEMTFTQSGSSGSTFSSFADNIYMWNTAAHRYDSFFLYDDSVTLEWRWSHAGFLSPYNPANLLPIPGSRPADAFWYVTGIYSAGPFDWTEVKPYAFP